MKTRSDGFLAEDKIDHKGEQFDYISELHEYLWRFVRAEFPFAVGNLERYLDVAIGNAEFRTKQAMKDK